MTDHNQRTDDQHRHRTKLYQRSFDPATESVCAELVQAVADLTNTDTTELPVLAERVDPDALNTLFTPRVDGTPRDTTGNIRFPYGEYSVHIQSEGTITLYEPSPFPAD